MKICFIGPANSSHIIKWCSWFSTHGHEVHVISFTSGEILNTTVHLIDVGVNPNGNDFGKLAYLLTGKRIRQLVNYIKPDIVNVHYATSYGISAALSGIKGYFLSVWGSDIYDFPNKSIFHKLLLKFSLRKARHLFSTSQAMADEASKYTKKHFDITPFGIDLTLFAPDKRTRKDDDQTVIVGTVKALSDVYGIRDILTAVSILKNTKNLPIKLRIAGRGPQEAEYHKMAADLGIDDITTWLGFISQEKASEEWANMDIAIIPSLQESFGVSAVEAQACGTAVIVSDVPGLKEATKPGSSSIVVRKHCPEDIVNAVIDLINDSGKRHQYGLSGRKYVAEKYEIDSCFSRIEDLYIKYIT